MRQGAMYQCSKIERAQEQCATSLPAKKGPPDLYILAMKCAECKTVTLDSSLHGMEAVMSGLLILQDESTKI